MLLLAAFLATHPGVVPLLLVQAFCWAMAITPAMPGLVRDPMTPPAGVRFPGTSLPTGR